LVLQALSTYYYSQTQSGEFFRNQVTGCAKHLRQLITGYTEQLPQLALSPISFVPEKIIGSDQRKIILPLQIEVSGLL
jgi:hypothetical protein